MPPLSAPPVRTEPLLPLDAIASATGIGTGTLLRWIVSGKKKVKLAAVRRRGEWWTSVAAVGRFRAAT